MNEKEAREIVQDIRNVGVPGTDSYEELDHAKGYLEALSKAKGLEEALTDIHDIAFDGDGDPMAAGLGRELADIAKAALAKYHSVK